MSPNVRDVKRAPPSCARPRARLFCLEWIGFVDSCQTIVLKGISKFVPEGRSDGCLENMERTVSVP